jgi:hypothetical protein
MNASMLALNRALIQTGLPVGRLQRFGAVRLLGRALGKFGISRAIARVPNHACLVDLAWPNDGRAFPYALAYEIVPWICDCWPHDYPRWERLFRRNRIRLAFISSQGSTRYFAQRIPEMKCIWMPEACDPAEYNPEKPLAQRSIHLLELGRKYKPFHDAVRAPVAAASFKHIFSLDGTRTPIFPDQPSLIRALGDTMISVCFPKTITHPDLAGGLETATLRYFESIASGCLLLGHCPTELRDLFGYDPVIKADLSDPGGQAVSLIRSIADHQPFVDRNRARLLEVGAAQARARSILEVLRQEGWTA